MFYSMVEGFARTPARPIVSFWRSTLGGCGSSPAFVLGFPPRDIRMNFDELRKRLADAPLSFRHRLQEYLWNPTERNACYITGYIAALDDVRLFKTADTAGYWLAVVGKAECVPDLSEKLLAEMDN